MLQVLIAEHSNLLHNFKALKDKYDKSEKTCQELNTKYVELVDTHTIYKNKYMKIRRNFECICILYIIAGGLYYNKLIDEEMFYITTVIMILLSFVIV